MSTTDPIAEIAAQSQAAAAAAHKSKSANDLGIDEFLTLLTTQLKNQDPMKPMDGTEFVAQLAQFGAVSGIQQMQTSMESLASSLRSAQVLDGATLVGREVLAFTDHIELAQGSVISGEIEVPPGVSHLQVRITDADGAIVQEITLSPGEGTTEFTWDGLRSDGTQADAGSYQIEAIASGGGISESLGVLLSTRVSSVTIDSAGAGLTLNTAGLGAVPLAHVRRVM